MCLLGQEKDKLDLKKCEEALKVKYGDVLRAGLPINSDPVTNKFNEGIFVRPLFCTKAKLLPLHIRKRLINDR